MPLEHGKLPDPEGQAIDELSRRVAQLEAMVRRCSMKKFLLSVSILAASYGTGARARGSAYWVEPCTNPETACVAGDVELARWALEAWEQVSGGRLHCVATDRDHALIRMVWAMPAQGLYGETVPIKVHGLPGAQMYVRIEDEGTSDKLMHATHRVPDVSA